MRAITIEIIVRIFPTAEPQAQLKKLQVNQNGAEHRETILIDFSLVSHRAFISSKTPLRANRSRKLLFTTAIIIPAVSTQTFVIMTIQGFWLRCAKTCFLPAKTEAMAARISNIAPVKAPNKTYCNMYKKREIKLNRIICGRRFC